MLKIISDKMESKDSIPMGDMKPLEVGFIEASNTYVMRTASKDKFEVIDLSHPRKNGCWTAAGVDVPVMLLKKYEKITVEFFN
jgi:hypothetical protein